MVHELSKASLLVGVVGLDRTRTMMYVEATVRKVGEIK